MDYNRASFDEAHEMLGVGQIVWTDDHPTIHLQAGGAKERGGFIGHMEEADIAVTKAFILDILELSDPGIAFPGHES